MKKDLHPSNYREVAFKDMSNEEVFITRSTVNSKETIEIDGKTYPLVKLEITSSSHPFFTGKQKLVDTAGRVDKFLSRYGDRKITPGVTSPAANYDVNFNGTNEDRQVFNHLNRLDVSAIVGISYEYKHLRASFYIDHGFMATSEGDDILRILENGTSNKVDVKIPNGNNVSYMLSIGYSLGSFMKE